METSRHATFRIPIILLALIDLVALGARLWPWQEVMNLPGNGTTGIDPAITLAAYVGLGFWIGGSVSSEPARKALFSAAMLGLLAGFFLVALVFFSARQQTADAPGIDNVQIGLLAAAALILGVVGLRTARAGYTTGFSVVCTIWASMVCCLAASTAILGQLWFGAGPAESADPWKDYQGLAIGTPALQALVHALDSISGFLLIGPLIGCIAGAVFASFGKPAKP